MTLKEKNLYQQIHPLKLSTDIILGFYTTYLLWQHNVFLFLVLFLAPSLLVTLLIIRFSDLEWLKRSSFGKYLSRYMTPPIVAIRIIGQIIMWVAGWYHLFILIIIGFLLIAGGWCNGLILKMIIRKEQ